MNLPADWKTESTSGPVPGLGRLVHIPCGFRSFLPYDVVIDTDGVRAVVYGHQCEE